MLKLPGEITREEYAQYEGVNWSTLGKMRKSPKHYKHGLTEPSKSTAALATGSALHTLVFEPELFAERFVVYDKPKNRGTGSKTAWEAFKTENSHLTILGPEDEIAALMMSATVCESPANQYIGPSKGRAEIPLTWTDPETGILCKGRLDYVTTSGIVIDLKSARSTEIRALGRQAWTLGYFHQMAFYRRGLAVTLGRKLADVDCIIVAVENEAPYDCTICEMDAQSMAEADSEISALLDKLASCRKSGRWPGRYDKPQILTAPSYVLMDDNDQWEIETKAEGATNA